MIAATVAADEAKKASLPELFKTLASSGNGLNSTGATMLGRPRHQGAT